MIDMESRTACFTGHRELPTDDLPEISKRLEDTLVKLIEQGYRYFGAGGALGFDTLAAQVVLRLRERYPQIRLILVLPCLNQTRGWPQADIDAYEEIKRCADKVTYTSEHYFRGCIYAATLEDLREQEEQILVDQHDGIKANIKNVTVNDVYELWCQLKRGIKDSTMKNYIYMYELFVKPTFGKKKLVQVKKSDVRRFYNQLIDDKVLKPSTVDVIHNIVHQVFQIAVDDDMIRSNPAANMLREIKMAHGSEIEKRKALTLEQEELFLGYLARTSKYQHWYPVFYIMANTGMRVGEITGLRWCDVDMENGIISVNHTLVYYNHRDEKGCYFSINTPKTKAGIREIPMTEGVKQAFLMEKEFQEECGMKSVSHIEGYSDFVFVNRNGEVQHQGTLNKALQRIMRDCNSEVLEKKGVDSDPALLPKFSCHVLRHTFATRMCESGLNVKVVQSVLGHADVTTTLDIYVTVTNDLKKREITAFETYLKTGAKQMANV